MTLKLSKISYTNYIMRAMQNQKGTPLDTAIAKDWSRKRTKTIFNYKKKKKIVVQDLLFVVQTVTIALERDNRKNRQKCQEWFRRIRFLDVFDELVIVVRGKHSEKLPTF